MGEIHDVLNKVNSKVLEKLLVVFHILVLDDNLLR